MKDVTVASYYSELKRPLVLYSCVANDLFYFFNTSLESLNAAKLFKIITNFGNGLSLLESEVKSNLETLTAYNPNAVIIVMGLYAPSDNCFLQRLGSIILSKVNRTLEGVCSEYANAYYTDVSCLSFAVLDDDFHPDEEGHIILRNIIEATIPSMGLHKEIIVEPSIDDLPSNYALVDNKSADITLDELMKYISRIGLPETDYVWWAVVAEKALHERRLSNISYDSLEKLKEDSAANNLELEYKALTVLVIEKRIQNGINTMFYTMNKNAVNDKLSLLSYP